MDGPILDGTWEPRLRSAQEELAEVIADGLIGLLREYFHASFRYERSPRTGNYERTVRKVIKDGDMVVTDEGIVYGNWLEGTSSRNHATRFKGYWSFRKAAQAAGGREVGTGQHLVTRALGG